jgi:hypothetical protein
MSHVFGAHGVLTSSSRGSHVYPGPDRATGEPRRLSDMGLPEPLDLSKAKRKGFAIASEVGTIRVSSGTYTNNNNFSLSKGASHSPVYLPLLCSCRIFVSLAMGKISAAPCSTLQTFFLL